MLSAPVPERGFPPQESWSWSEVREFYVECMFSRNRVVSPDGTMENQILGKNFRMQPECAADVLRKVRRVASVLRKEQYKMLQAGQPPQEVWKAVFGSSPVPPQHIKWCDTMRELLKCARYSYCSDVYDRVLQDYLPSPLKSRLILHKDHWRVVP